MAVDQTEFNSIACTRITNTQNTFTCSYSTNRPYLNVNKQPQTLSDFNNDNEPAG